MALRPVLYVIDNLEFGGGERGVLQLVRGRAAAGGRVGVAAHPGGVFEREVRAAGAAFLPLDLRRLHGLGAVPRLRRLVRAGGWALVHSQGARADVVTRLALAGLRGVRHVCTVQMPVEGFDVGRLRRALYLALDRWSARRVDRFLVVSEALRRLLVEARGIAPERVRLVYNGVELDAPLPAAAGRALRAALGLAAEAPVVGAVGRLVWQKGFEDLIAALPAVVRAVPGVRLLLVGDGPRRAALAAAAAAAGVADRVVLAGFRADVPAVLAAVDVLAVPSRREGFPMITLEALAAGTPVVATAIDGLLEQIEPERSGLLVPPGAPTALAAALVRVLTDRDLRARLAAEGRRRVAARFDVRATLAATWAVYRELLGEAGPA